MTAVPPAVRAAAERANKAQENYIEAQKGGPVETPPAPPAPAPQPDKGAPPPAPPAAAAPAPAPPQPAPAPALEAPPGKPSYEDLEHMFKSEQGRNNALRRQLDDMGRKLDDMGNLLAGMNKKETPAPAPQEIPKVEWTKEEQEEWGEALPIIEKKAREIVQASLAPLEMKFQDGLKEIGARVQSVTVATVKDARQKMMDTLNADTTINFPNRKWIDINEEDEFGNWVLLPDPLTGVIRKDILQDAWNRNEASRVAAMFRLFLKETGASPAPTPQPAPGNGATPPGPGLEAFAAPGAPRTAAPAPQAAETDFFTTGDVERFYRDKQLGRWKGREAEADQYEAKIIAAGKENKIRPGAPQP